MNGPERRAVVVTTASALGPQTNGATLRAAEVATLLEASGYQVLRSPPCGPPIHNVDLAVVVSYACAGTVPHVQRRARRVWLDAVDSWLLVNGSGLRRGHPTYALRGLRDAARLALMPRVDLVTYISEADLTSDHGTVRGRRRLVLPSRTAAPTPGPSKQEPRVVLAGDWAYGPNRDALRWFCGKILPLLEAQAADDGWEVNVYGPGAHHHGSRRVRVLGYAEAPGELYRWNDVHAAPVRFGAGVKRKVLLPLLAGLPVVTTPAGAHGLRQHPLLDVRRDAAGFAAAVADRLRRPVEKTVPAADEILDRNDADAVSAWLRA